MKSSVQTSMVILLVVLVLGYLMGFGSSKLLGSTEGFSGSSGRRCGACGTRVTCPPCREPDLSKYVLKSSIPPSNQCPDLSLYILKSEVPPVPDLSKYVLRSSIPKPQPVIIDSSACSKQQGECPPCPRPRCPAVQCPPPTQCPQPAPCPRPVCPPTTVKCKAEESISSTVRPFLAPLSLSGYGMS
jgi:hypothetical protein